MTYKRNCRVVSTGIILCFLLIGCDSRQDQAIPENGYGFHVKTVEENAFCSIHKISIQTKSMRKVFLSAPSGKPMNSVGSISPGNSQLAEVDITLIVNIVRPAFSTNNEPQVLVTMVSQTPNGTSFNQESMPGGGEISELLEIPNVEGVSKGKTTLIRIKTADQAIELFVE